MFGGMNRITGIEDDFFGAWNATSQKYLGPRKSLIDLEGAFICCPDLGEVNIKLLLRDMDNLSNVSHMFADCSNLVYNMSDENTGKLFDNCTSL